jgi:broad specificity phosphatase PhoE
LPTITLVRHGTPDWDFRTPIAGAALARWLEGERDAALVPAQRPSEELLARVRGVRCVVASPLRRSIESARLVAPALHPMIDECFTEPAQLARDQNIHEPVTDQHHVAVLCRERGELAGGD